MNKNHFIYPYYGNKRKESKNIIDEIDFKNVETIIEPFCGSSAVSYKISQLYPKKFKYIINDSDEDLINLYKIMKDEVKINYYNLNMNIQIHFFNKYNNDVERKKYYEKNTTKNFKRKYYSRRSGLYPLMKRCKQIKEFDIRDYGIYNFIKNEDVEIRNIDAVDLIDEYKNNEKSFMFIDPPYIDTCNKEYNYTIDKNNHNIYEYIYMSNFNSLNSQIIFVLEDIWIIRLLFKDAIIKEPYDKLYGVSNKQTKHIIIKQKKKI
jgi:site-specific DNA-adenine methylase